MLLRSHVRLSTYISHFSTLFQNFISCSQKIWFCVFLELGKPYLRQNIPTNCQLNAKSSSVLPHWRCNLFVLHYWFWCHSKWYFFKYPVAFQIISLPFSFVYLTAVTRYKELLHRARVHLKVPGWLLVWNALLSKTLPMFLSRLNEINGGCEKILPVSGSFWSNLKFFRLMDFTAWLWGWMEF